MKIVTKAKCARCQKRLKPKTAGRPALYCSASCRQRAYEKRRWTPYSALDALARDLLPPPTLRKLTEAVRHQHMLELIMMGTVPLNNLAQINGILDKVKGPEKIPLPWKIEIACQRRADDAALATITRWRLAQQQA